MIPNSENTPSIAVTARPDWAAGVMLMQTHQSAIFTGRSGMEQRGRSRAVPKHRLKYTLSGLSNAEQRAALKNAQAEGRSVCVVPFWTERARIVNALTLDEILLNTDPRPGFWQPGQYVYLFDPTLGGQFRQISAADNRTLTLEELEDALDFPAGCYVYPAIHCRRLLGADDLTRSDWTSGQMQVEYETL